MDNGIAEPSSQNPLDKLLDDFGVFSSEQLDVLRREAIETVGDLLGATAGLQNAASLDGWLAGLGESAEKLREFLSPELLRKAAEPQPPRAKGALPEPRYPSDDIVTNEEHPKAEGEPNGDA